MDKRNFCKFAVLEYWFEETEEPGRVIQGDNVTVTDMRGFWKLTGVRCAHPKLLEATKERGLPLFWCKNPEKCDLREEGNPSVSLSWVES